MVLSVKTTTEAAPGLYIRAIKFGVEFELIERDEETGDCFIDLVGTDEKCRRAALIRPITFIDAIDAVQFR